MEINIDWYRWIVASIAKHFDGYKGTYHLYIEGDERDTDEMRDFAELRTDGPDITRVCKQLMYLDIQVNILIQSHMDPSDLYAGARAVGIFSRGFTKSINVYKYGSGPNDDDSLLGCLVIRTKRNENTVDIGNFGIIHQDARITQFTIEGHYRLELKE